MSDQPTDNIGAADLVLGPATRMLWRGPDAVELGLGVDGVVVEGMRQSALHALAPSPQLDTARLDASPDVTLDLDHRRALAALARAGYLWPRADAADHCGPTSRDPRLAPPAPRLAPELRALQVRRGQDAADVLAERRLAAVEIEGTGRAAVQIATVLGAAGVGRVRCTGSGTVRLAHVTAGGLLPDDEGTDFGVAADRAVLRAAPDVDVTPLGPTDRRDLVVLALDGPLTDERRGALHADDVAHLCATVGPARGVVGPLVVPGLSSCVHCADLTRRDHDPAWDALAVQLTTPGRYGPASAAAVTTLVAALAALQVLAFLDGEQPAAIDGTLEIVEPDWRVRRRTWTVHPDCGCSATHAG